MIGVIRYIDVPARITGGVPWAVKLSSLNIAPELLVQIPAVLRHPLGEKFATEKDCSSDDG